MRGGEWLNTLPGTDFEDDTCPSIRFEGQTNTILATSHQRSEPWTRASGAEAAQGMRGRGGRGVNSECKESGTQGSEPADETMSGSRRSGACMLAGGRNIESKI